MANKTISTEFDVMDILLYRQERESKRLCEYILNQEPVLTEFSKMTGFFTFEFNSGVVGDAFNRVGHKNLRVRVSGFSDYFAKLNEALQDDVIERATKIWGERRKSTHYRNGAKTS